MTISTMRRAYSGIDDLGTTGDETMEKGYDCRRDGGETHGKGGPPIRGLAQDLRIERSMGFFSVHAGELYPDIA